MYDERRFKFLDKTEIETIMRESDLVYIDMIAGEQVIVINIEADYNRPMFIYEKGHFDIIDEAYINSLVFSLRYKDGSVDFHHYIMNIHENINDARKDISELFNYTTKYLLDDDNNAYGYMVIKIKGEWRGEINLNILNNEELSEYELISYGITKCKVIRHLN